MTAPTLAVLLPVYNAAEFLTAAIDSILGQTYRDFRFVIVDDGSTDTSSAIIARYASADSRIVHLSKLNGGITAALNFGLRQINDTYVARMDADDVALPERFARQIARLESDPGLAALGTRVHCIDRSGRLRHLRPVTTGAAAVAAALPFRNAINHPSVMIRRTALAEAHGYREKYRFSQDYDLWLRLSGKHRLDNLAETLLHYRTYDGRASSATNRVRQTVCSVAAATEYFARKYALPDSDISFDMADPATVTAALRALLGLELGASDRKALYRHGLRLARYGGQSGAITEFRRFLQVLLWERRELAAFGKLMLYSFTNRMTQRPPPTQGSRQ